MAFGYPFSQGPNATKGFQLVTARLESTSPRIASRRLTRAVKLLVRAGRQLESASLAAPDKYNQDRLKLIASGLRAISIPLCKIASHLERRGAAVRPAGGVTQPQCWVADEHAGKGDYVE